MVRKAILSLFICLIASSYIAAKEETIGIDEGNFAVLLGTAMGINKEVGIRAQPQDYIELLSHYGIEPLDGWDAKRPLRLDRLVAILMRAKNIKHTGINDAENCFNNRNEINKQWFLDFKRKESWMSKDEILKGKPRCPFGVDYEDKDKDHLIDKHNHPGTEEIEEAYIKFALENNLSIPRGSSKQVVSRAGIREVIKSFSGEPSSLNLYLTPATPILPRDIAVIEKPTGDLVFVVYENGSSVGRKVNWSPTWTEDSSVEVAIVYANDASLPRKRSIIMFINAIEVGSSMSTWTTELTPDEYIWIGAQSQTGKLPAGATLSDFKTSGKAGLEEILMDENTLTFFSKLDSPYRVTSPKKGLGGSLSTKLSGKQSTQEMFRSGGFVSLSEGQYALFPIQNMNHLKGSFSLKIKPNFISSKDEHVFLSTVHWNAKGGADGFYLYYQPAKGLR